MAKEHVTVGDSGNVTGGDFTKQYGMRADILQAFTNAESIPDRADVVTDGVLARRERARFERGTRDVRTTVVRREAPVAANVGYRTLVATDGDVFRIVPDDHLETVEDEELTSP